MLRKFIKKLRKDKGLSYGYYQSQIANFFMDECKKCKKQYKNRLDLCKIANLAAIKFLDLLIEKK